MVHVRELVWDAWNVGHIARHEVTPDEVEEVCRMDVHTSRTYKGRIRVIGQAKTGRMLTVILAPVRPEVYYPVTARPASRREREMYRSLERGVTE